MKLETKLSKAWMTTMAALALGALAAACEPEPMPEPTPALAGSWTGRGRFQQSWAGKSTAVDVLVNLTFDDNGGPDSLPALGMVTPWRMYVIGDSGAPERSLRLPLQNGGTIWAGCPGEADGPANELAVQPDPRAIPPGSDTVAFQYRARYHFADLFEYTLYAYTDPGAPEVQVDARDSYRTSRDYDGDRLTVASRAVGTDQATGSPLELRFDGQLTRGQRDVSIFCRLGPPAP
jgi:hypothetical protein